MVDPGVTRVQIRFDLKRGDEIPYVPARLNGHPEAYVLFDTGAERNLLDRAYAESIGIGPILPGGAVHGACERFQGDPHWRDLVLFYEYFHGDDGRGVGASHQTGWTGLVAKLLQQTGTAV